MKELRSLEMNPTKHSVDTAALVANEACGVVLHIEGCLAAWPGWKKLQLRTRRMMGNLRLEGLVIGLAGKQARQAH